MSKEEFLRMRAYYFENSVSWPDMEIRRPKAPLATGFKPVMPKLELEPDALVLSTLVDEKRGRLYVGRTVIDDWVGGGQRREGFDKWDDVVVFDLGSGKRIGHTNGQRPDRHDADRNRRAPGDARAFPDDQGRSRGHHRLGI